MDDYFKKMEDGYSLEKAVDIVKSEGIVIEVETTKQSSNEQENE